MTALYPAVEPAPAARPARPRSGGWLWTVPSVRWAAAALALFLTGLAAQLLGAPQAVVWTLYLACYVSVAGNPRGSACGPYATAHSTSTC